MSFFVNASVNAQNWFESPNEMRHYIQYEFTKNLVLFSKSDLELGDPAIRHRYPLLDYFLETVLLYQGDFKNADGTLGVDLKGGQYFEDLFTSLNKTGEPSRSSKIGEKPAVFFERMLSGLCKSSQSIHM